MVSMGVGEEDKVTARNILQVEPRFHDARSEKGLMTGEKWIGQNNFVVDLKQDC
jgi:hypothetical protein